MNNSKEKTGKEGKSAVEGLFIRHNVKDFFVQNDEKDFPMFFSDIIHLQYVDELKELQQRIAELETDLMEHERLKNVHEIVMTAYSAKDFKIEQLEAELKRKDEALTEVYDTFLLGSVDHSHPTFIKAEQALRPRQ